MNTCNLMRRTVRNKRSVACWYHGLYPILSLHLLEIKNSRYRALLLQKEGDSSDGLRITNEENWRCTYLDGIERPRSDEDPWGITANHSQRQTYINEVYYEVK